MHGVNKDGHVIRVHVGVDAVAEVGDVALGPEPLQHLANVAFDGFSVTVQRARIEVALQRSKKLTSCRR